jgi:large subunit ribosomal protein L15
MDISKLRVRVKNKAPKRLGRGTGSGTGKTSGRGNKGAGSRSGKTLPYFGFNGGNVPYIRKLPKRGFTNSFKIEYQIVNLIDIEERLKSESQINPQALEKCGLIKDALRPVKVLGVSGKSFTVKATFEADKFSASALKLIESAGGKAQPRGKA